MSTNRAVSQDSSRGRSKLNSLLLGVAVLFVCTMMASAASYMRTTLQELTSRAVGVVEIEVTGRSYPAMKPGDTFPRTHIDVKVHRALKGTLPDTFVLDTPGGIDGNVISHVPDAPDFKVGERAFVFVKTPAAGHYMVQDLGLGKFNIVEREGKKFVENPLCPRAIEGKLENQKDVDASLLTRSIPYDTFCKLVSSYASGAATEDAAKLAAVLAPSGSHSTQAPAVLADYNNIQREARARLALQLSILTFALVALGAALWVRHRRRTHAAPLSNRGTALLLAGALVLGGIGGTTSHAFVQFDQKTIWNLDKTTAGKVESAKIIWKQSTSVSKTNATCFPPVQASFDKWEAVNSSRLAFTAGGSTSVAINNSKDTENVVAWSVTPTNDFSASTLAICFSSFTVGTASNFIDCDIIFNDRDFNWGPTGDGNPASVSLHEIGHFVGLNHTTDNRTIMFPFDGGITVLSFDEVAAAQALYPGATEPTGGTTPPPPPPPDAGSPTAAASASPTSGQAPLAVSFDASASAKSPSNATITSFDWDFGDGGEATGATTSHTYTANGTYTATVTVTDANGMTSIASVEISVGKLVDVLKAGFKLNFKSLGKDSFVSVVSSEKLLGIKAAKGEGQRRDGSMLIGDQEWLFTFDTEKLKSTQKGGPSIKVNDKTGIATITVKNADLRDVLGGHGAVNDDVFGESIDVPFTVWFGEGSDIYLFGEVPFQYNAQADKAGVGTF